MRCGDGNDAVLRQGRAATQGRCHVRGIHWSKVVRQPPDQQRHQVEDGRVARGAGHDPAREVREAFLFAFFPHNSSPPALLRARSAPAPERVFALTPLRGGQGAHCSSAIAFRLRLQVAPLAGLQGFPCMLSTRLSGAERSGAQWTGGLCGEGIH
eukprot:UN2468